MNRNKIKEIKNEITQHLDKFDISVNYIKLSNIKNDNGLKIHVSLAEYDTGHNSIVVLKDAIDEIETKYGISFSTRTIDF